MKTSNAIASIVREVQGELSPQQQQARQALQTRLDSLQRSVPDSGHPYRIHHRVLRALDDLRSTDAAERLRLTPAAREQAQRTYTLREARHVAAAEDKDRDAAALASEVRQAQQHAQQFEAEARQLVERLAAEDQSARAQQEQLEQSLAQAMERGDEAAVTELSAHLGDAISAGHLEEGKRRATARVADGKSRAAASSLAQAEALQQRAQAAQAEAACERALAVRARWDRLAGELLVAGAELIQLDANVENSAKLGWTFNHLDLPVFDRDTLPGGSLIRVNQLHVGALGYATLKQAADALKPGPAQETLERLETEATRLEGDWKELQESLASDAKPSLGPSASAFQVAVFPGGH
jgi:hypothetical protein